MIILDIDYEEMYKFHKENNCDITLAVVYKKFKNQYGLCDVKENKLIKIEENLILINLLMQVFTL